MHIYSQHQVSSYTLVFLLFFILCKQSECQFTFSRSCNDPDIMMHTVTNGHTYCSHACRGAAPTVIDSCGANGDCTCIPPCSDDPAVLAMPAMLPSNDICPPAASDPADPDPTALPACMSRCAAACGGVALICGETSLLGPTMMTVAKVCTCACPAMPCTTTTTTTTTTTPATTTTTTTTMATTTTTTTSAPVQVAIIKKPLIFILKIKKLVLLLLKKLPLIAMILFKVVTLYLFKCLVVSAYLYMAKQFILWELSQLSGWLWWILERFQAVSSYF